MALIAEMKIAENYQHVLEQIAAAAAAAGRDPKEVKLVVVTKGHSVADIQAVTPPVQAGWARIILKKPSRRLKPAHPRRA